MRDDEKVRRAVTVFIVALAVLLVGVGLVAQSKQQLSLVSFLALVWIGWMLTAWVLATNFNIAVPSYPKRHGRIILLSVGVVYALGVSSDTELVHLWNRAHQPPPHKVLESSYPDTESAGAYAARADLQRGIRRIMVYGLIWDLSPFSEIQRHGFDILFGGCIWGGTGFAFWGGYNTEMVTEAKRLHVADIPFVHSGYERCYFDAWYPPRHGKTSARQQPDPICQDLI